MSKRLTANLMEKLTSKIEDEYVEFFISTGNEEERVSFTIKSKPSFGEMLFIVNKTVDTINSLDDFRIELKKIIFYGFLLNTISTFPVPKTLEDDMEIYDYSTLKLYLDRINFEKQLRVIGTIDGKERDLLFSVSEMEKFIDEKIEYHNKLKIHNSDIIKEAVENINNIVKSLKIIPEIIEKFTSSLDGVNNEDVKTLLSTLSALNKDGNLNLNNISDSIVTSYMNKRENNDIIEESVIHGAAKEFENIVDINDL